jgi:glutaredoxin-like protein
MALLNDKIRDQVSELFNGMEAPVKLVMFTQGGEGPVGIECTMCSDTRQLVEEVAGLSDKVSLEVYDLIKDAQIASFYKVDKIPAIAILGGEGYKDYGIRLYGIPSGYEFSTLIEDIRMASSGKTDLSEKTLRELKRLNKPVHIQVYVTPT